MNESSFEEPILRLQINIKNLPCRSRSLIGNIWNSKSMQPVVQIFMLIKLLLTNKHLYMKKIISIFLLLGLIFSHSTLAASRLPKDYKKNCIVREIYAKEMKTGKTQKFASTCDVPEGWVLLGK